MDWRYKLERPFEMVFPELSGVQFENEWLCIKDNALYIPEAYAWDGCSPTYSFRLDAFVTNGVWFGPWDGPLGIDARPVTWKATVVHDALCQFRTDILNLKKQVTISIFKRLLHENNSPKWMTNLYPFVVNRFGPQDWRGGL